MTSLAQYDVLRQQGGAYRKSLEARRAVLDHQVLSTQSNLDSALNRQDKLKEQTEDLKMAAVLLQELVDSVAAKNILRTEELVNSALSTIFTDMKLDFKIISEIKRNANSYRMVIVENGVEGNLNSFGGGVWAIVAFVLKVLFNILGKRHPMLAFDESLSFLSEKYIPNASAFIKDLSREFNMPILLVTHQPLFTQASDQIYTASSAGKKTVKFTVKTAAEAADSEVE